MAAVNADGLQLGARRFDLLGRAVLVAVLGPVPSPGGAAGRDAHWQRAEAAATEGADVLEVAPAGLKSVEADDELLARSVASLRSRCGLALSVRTGRASAAAAAYDAGAALAHDGGQPADRGYLTAAASAGAAVVLSHAGPATSADAAAEVAASLSKRAAAARAAGVRAPNVLIDAGLDLGKAPAQAGQLLRASGALASLGYPVVLSVSAGTFPPDGVVAAQALGLSLGCRVLRARDVERARRVRDMIAAILEAR